MIQITNLNFANLTIDDLGEPIIYGQELTPFQEHQVCAKICKMLLAEGIQADIATNAKIEVD